MEITEHQANMLRALADGKRMQVVDKTLASGNRWDITTLDNFMLFISDAHRYEVRIKPDVIVVNGIEVPAPEKVAPASGASYWVALPTEECGASAIRHWRESKYEFQWIEFGIVHLDPESACIHGKAMRAHKPG